MIAPLRRRHLLTWASLGVLLPTVYAAALLARVPPARMELPTELAQDSALGPTTQLRSWAVLWPGELLGARLFVAGSDIGDANGKRALRIEPIGELHHPDLLVYWSPEPVTALPGLVRAWLLGSVDPTRARTFTLPPEAVREPGYAVLFSLAEQRILASTPLGGDSQSAARTTP